MAIVISNHVIIIGKFFLDFWIKFGSWESILWSELNSGMLDNHLIHNNMFLEAGLVITAVWPGITKSIFVDNDSQKMKAEVAEIMASVYTFINQKWQGAVSNMKDDLPCNERWRVSQNSIKLNGNGLGW